ncbi:MAG TPA: glycosyltransferase family 4 protein [Thermoplasmata archaeon]|nr:glycosyltransferase family 4 protein [Thermoplasmata archaeon]
MPSSPSPPVARVRRSRLSQRELTELTHLLAWRRPAGAPSLVAALTVPRQLHVLMVGWEFPPFHSGGLGVHSYELVKELGRMGHKVTFLTPFPGPFTPVDGTTFIHPGDPRQGDVPYPGAYEISPGTIEPGTMEAYNDWVASRIALGKFDVVHVHDWFGTVGARDLAKSLGLPLVMTVHSTEYDRSLGHPWQEILEREQAGLDAADRVIAVSRHLKEQLVERYHASPDKVKVIYNAVRPSSRLSRLEQSKRLVLYLGRLAAMKGVDTFLRAAARIIAFDDETLFVVAGEGPEYPRLVTLAAHLGIGDRVLFLGRVTEDERAVLLSSASVFVLPSVVEPFGIAALEAMAAGVPAIVSKTSGVAEISGAVFAVDFWDIDEFASRIEEVLQYPALRRAMGEVGRWEALREGWPERAIQTVGVYAELVVRRSDG